jgi:pyruvate,water dikinase
VLIPLDSASARCGAKAETLGRLLRARVPVPDGFVVPDALATAGWEPEVAPALRRVGGRMFAVRSSAVGEDGARASFAGQLHTTLGLSTTDQVIEAVRRSAGSHTSREAAAYMIRTGSALAPQVPVIVQRMLQPDAAGVLFTRHPVTGDDQVVVEAVRGLGDRLAEGSVTPHAWIVGDDEIVGPVDAVRAVLTRGQVIALTAMGRRVEARLGGPQDVEWCEHA